MNKREALRDLLLGRLSIEELERATKKEGNIVGVMKKKDGPVFIGQDEVSFERYNSLACTYQGFILLRLYPEADQEDNDFNVTINID